MPIKLIADSGGSVTLDVPTTASTYNLTIPASNGTFAIVDSAGYANFGTLGITFSNNVTVNGNTSITGKLTVTGNATFSNTVTVTGNATFSNTLLVTGNATFSNTLTVTGNATFSNTVTVAASGITFSDATVQTTAAAAGSQLVSRTALSYSAATNGGTTLDFTDIPSWVKRITVMFNGVSAAAASSLVMVQVGSGSISTSGYISQLWGSSALGTTVEGMFALSTGNGSANYNVTGQMIISLFGSNTWISTAVAGFENVVSTGCQAFGKSPALSGALDRIRVTFYSGSSSTFDAGSINILYE